MLLTVSGCSSSRGLSHQALQQSFHEHPNVVTDQDVAKTLACQGHLPAAYRLTTLYKYKDFPGSPTLRKVDWISADAERLQRALEPVKEEGILQQSFRLANSSVQGTTFRDIRLRPQPDTMPTRFFLSMARPRWIDTTTVMPGGMRPASASTLHMVPKATRCS